MALVRFPTVPMARADESPIDRAAQSIYAAVATFYDEPAQSFDEAMRVAALVNDLTEYLAATHLAMLNRAEDISNQRAAATCFVTAADHATFFDLKDVPNEP